MVNTAPELQPSAFGMTLDTINADSLVIEAYVDAERARAGLPNPLRRRRFEGSFARSEADADFHHLPSGTLDGTPHAEPRPAVVLEDQRARIAFPTLRLARAVLLPACGVIMRNK